MYANKQTSKPIQQPINQIIHIWIWFICCSGDHDSWTGLRLDGGMRWDDSTMVDFTSWSSGDPDYPGEPEQYCGIQWYDQMKDRKPSDSNPFTCQYNTSCRPLVQPMVTDLCPSPFLPISNQCIYLHHSSTTRFRAARACAAICGNCRLASIHSQEQAISIKKLLEAK